jgi:hypothetical protein
MIIECPTLPVVAGWLDRYVWPQIQTMMVNDAYFKLMGRARELTGEFNGPIARLMVSGYVTSQVVAIRRFCDSRKDVISLRRVLLAFYWRPMVTSRSMTCCRRCRRTFASAPCS